jgi:uncharacterized protein (DUF433 family)
VKHFSYIFFIKEKGKLRFIVLKKWEKHIEANPEIMYGKPVIKGTRIPVDLILEKMSNGQNFHEIGS